MGPARVKAFQRIVKTYYRTHTRDLPWRRGVTVWRVLVSEVMLQQTQADRVVPKYKEFIRAFPTPRILAEASLTDVLRLWQGLGYNRRAKLLQQTARILVAKYGGRIPHDPDILHTLPGIGRGSAGAIAAFAYNKPVVFIETNIRTVFLHHFFPKEKNVSDRKLLPYIEKTLDRRNPREWYSALMDYGVHLKRMHGNPSRRSAHHVRQSRFEGSDRQLRGMVIRVLLEKKTCTEKTLTATLKKEPARVNAMLHTLITDGLVVRHGHRYALMR